MKSLPTQKRALEKRSALISAARRSFAQHGYDRTTAKTIAQNAGVATGTFYQNFENKDDILRTVAQYKRDEILHAVPGLQLGASNAAGDCTTEGLFRRVLEVAYDYHASEAELHQVLEQRRFIDGQLDAVLRHSEAVLEDKVLAFVKTFNVGDPAACAYNLFAMVEGLVHRHVFGAPTSSKQATLDLGAKMLACYFECEHGDQSRQ